MSHAVVWPSEDSVETRAKFAVALVGALGRTELPVDVMTSITGALGLAADDPSPRVRLALAEAIAGHPQAPVNVIAQLAGDRPDIAGIVIARSPAIQDRDVPELARRLDTKLLPTLALRVATDGSAQLILAQGDAQVAVALLMNPDVALHERTLTAIAELHGENAKVRELLFARTDLPLAARFALVERLCSVLSASGLVTNVLGDARSSAMLDEAQGVALIAAVRNRSRGEIDVLVGQLSERAELDGVTILRALVHGEIDLFASILCRLSGMGPRRVRGVMRTGRKALMRALLERCGLCAATAALVADAYRIVGSDERALTYRTSRLLTELQAECNATSRMLNAIQRWHNEALRQRLPIAA